VGNLFSALDIAVSGLQSHQAAIQTTGHNIANVDTDGYSRQRAELVSRWPQDTPVGPMGRGVRIADIFRIRDPFLDGIYQNETQNVMEMSVERDFLQRMEGILQEPGDMGLGALIDNFFASVQALANYPEELPLRASMVAAASVLADGLNDIHNRLEQLRTDANNEIITRVTEVNSLTREIADLNERIIKAEASGKKANDFRDQRTVLLDALAEIVDTYTVEMSDGSVSVLVGGDVLVDGKYDTPLATQVNPALDPDRDDFVEVVVAATGRPLTISGGRFKGLLDVRDSIVPNLTSDIDHIARRMIFEINMVHSEGIGLNGYTNLVSDNAVASPTADLDLPGLLNLTPEDGSFEISLIDTLGNVVTSVILVDLDHAGADDSLTDLAANIDSVANVSAVVTADNRLEITADPTYSFVFTNDTSNVLAALGLNTFFSGSDGSDIAVNPVIVNDPGMIAASLSTDPRDTGDNRNALAMAALQNAPLLASRTTTFNSFYEQTIATLGALTKRTEDQTDIAESFRQDIDRRREEVAGVNLDEEVANLTRYQHAYDASARVFSVINQLLDTLINGLI